MWVFILSMLLCGFVGVRFWLSKIEVIDIYGSEGSEGCPASLHDKPLLYGSYKQV